jgi:hypothetical protein
MWAFGENFKESFFHEGDNFHKNKTPYSEIQKYHLLSDSEHPSVRN